MRTKSRELLAVGVFGSKSRIGDRIELLLRRGRTFSPRASALGVAMSTIVLGVLMLAGSLVPRWIAFAQGQPRLTFEAASIKPNKAGGPISGGVGNGGASGRNVTLKFMLALAWRFQEFQISGGPGWVDSDRFDVEAKAADRNADPDQLRLMLQSLLADRFQLKFHRETKESSVYALVVGKDGLKMKLSADQTSAEVNGPSPPGAGPNHGAIRIGAGSLIGNAVTLPLFTRFLSQRLDHTIFDKTSLSGRFDIRLQWTPGAGENPLSPGGDALPPEDSSGPSVFSAIQEQLGLKLESAKGPVEVLVIDNAEKPDAN